MANFNHLFLKTRVITDTDSIVNNDYMIFAETDTSEYTVTLPDPLSLPSPSMFIIRREGAYTLIVDATNGTVNKSASVSIISDLASITVVNIGTDYKII